MQLKEKQLKKEKDFVSWFAGVLDGNGYFDLRKPKETKETKETKEKEKNKSFKSFKSFKQDFVLKAIQIKLLSRDLRMLTRIQNHLNRGKIRSGRGKPHVVYTICQKQDMEYIIKLVNGFILLRVKNFARACAYFNIPFKEGNYEISPLNSYFAGLIDTNGSIVFNYSANRIECHLQLAYTVESRKLSLNKVIPYYKPQVVLREKKITGKTIAREKRYKSIVFKYQTVGGMIFLYQAFLEMRLFCDFKFYRITSIKKFLSIRDFKSCLPFSEERKVYIDFVLRWIQYRNPLWVRVDFAKKLLKEIKESP